MAEKSRLPKQGKNLFQKIKEKSAEAINQGITPLKLSIGQPTGPALLSARRAAAEAIMSSEESMHEYQDNGSPGIPGFAEKFIQAHVPKIDLDTYGNTDFLPTPGTKPMLGFVIMACGGIKGNKITVATTTEPGYQTPAVCANFLAQNHYALTTNVRNQFIFNLWDIDPSTDLIMVNYPHNPSGQIATQSFWEQLCIFCRKYNIRLFNDAAYAMLAHSTDACTLTEVAVNFSDLSWAEAFSASKAIGNGTGWRVGAMCGSPDAINDMGIIKSEWDSGFNAALATGALYALENDMDSINKIRVLYQERTEILLPLLQECGMRLTVKPRAGFFSLWELPKKAFGEPVQNAEDFNYKMIKRTGAIGVHFHPYFRCAVVAPMEDPTFANAIRGAFEKAKVEY